MVVSLQNDQAKLLLQLARVREDFDELSKQTGPQGMAGIDGTNGTNGTNGEDGKSIDPILLRVALEKRLRELGFTVVFEAGDEESEPERIIRISIVDGELRIPPQVIRVRNVDSDGNQIGEALFDKAPLGMPSKLRFKPPVKASQ